MLRAPVVAIVCASAAAGACGDQRRRERQHREVAPMFAEIEAREAQYRAELGRYLSTGTEDEGFPASVPTRDGVPVGERPRLWKVLSIKPPFDKMFCQYVVVAGPANNAGSMGPLGREAYAGAVPTEDWFYSIARCDGDGDPAVDAVYLKRSDSIEIITKNPDR